ncbi:MAG: histidinol-phosphatase HisJ [Candidatus Helarchaeota archaeon]
MIDYHIHSKLCRHGEGNLEDYVKSAIKKGFTEIGFCEHFPEEFLLEDLPSKYHYLIPIEDYSMKMEEFPEYVNQVMLLKEKYENEISIKLGTEFDFLASKKKFIETQIKKHDFDYVHGSIHQIYIEGKPFAFDDNRYLYLFDDYDLVDCWEKYYLAVAELISSDLFDVISHLDLMKKYGHRLTDENKFNSFINKITELLQEHDSIIELNTAGARKKVGEFYPSDRILKKVHEKGIDITLGSDAHHPNEVGFMFDEAIKKLKEIGFKYIIKFNKRKKEKFFI